MDGSICACSPNTFLVFSVYLEFFGNKMLGEKSQVPLATPSQSTISQVMGCQRSAPPNTPRAGHGHLHASLAISLLCNLSIPGCSHGGPLATPSSWFWSLHSPSLPDPAFMQQLEGSSLPLRVPLALVLERKKLHLCLQGLPRQLRIWGFLE